LEKYRYICKYMYKSIATTSSDAITLRFDDE